MLASPRSRLYLAVALAVFGASQANAQETTTETSPDQAKTLDTVVVRASADASAKGLAPEYAGGQVARGARIGVLGNQDTMDTPFTVTSYTQQYIADQQARSVSDVLQADAAVRMARGYGNFQEVYMIRGFPLYSDDVAYNGLYGLLPRQFVAAELFERVEVFRGANAFVNGTTPGGSGVGGAINLLPKRAPNEDLNRITTGFDSGGQAYVAADVARRFGADQSQGLRLNAVKRDGNTSINHTDRDLSLASVGWDMHADRLRLSADVAFQEQRIKSPRPSVTPSSGIDIPAPPGADDNYAQTWTYSNEATTLGTFRGEYDLGKDTTTWLALGARHTSESNSLANPTLTDSQGTLSAYRYDNTRVDNAYTGEVGIRSKIATGPVEHSLSLAATRYELNSRNAYAFSDFSGFGSNLYSPTYAASPSPTYYLGGDLDNPNLTDKWITSSLAFGDTMAFDANRTLLTLGLRQQHITEYSYDYNSGSKTDSYSRGKLTPVAAVVYKFTPHFSGYVNYIESLARTPAASGTNISNTGQIFAPYVSRQKEVGLKYDGGRIGGTVAFYTTAKPNGQVDGGVYSISGKQRNRGIELSTYGQASSSVKLLGGVTFMQAKQISTASGAYDGKDAIGAPRVTANVGADWDIPYIPHLTLSGRVVYTGAQYVDNANTQRISSWRRYDAGARYPMEVGNTLVTWRANVENLTNKSYWASAGGYPGYGYLVQGEPRTLSVSATVEF